MLNMDSLAIFRVQQLYTSIKLCLHSRLSSVIFRTFNLDNFLSWNVENGNKALGCNPKQIQQRKAQKVSENMEYIVLSGTKSRGLPNL